MNRLFGVKYVDPLFWIREEIIEVVDSRRSSNVKRRDYLQLLMDACSDSMTSMHENQKISFSQIYLNKKLTIDEIKMNLSIFLMAGSESTSIALTVLLHVLATFPEEQQKLINEIDEYFPLDIEKKVEPTYDDIQKLEYLDFIIKETLRMWPIANAACTRRCVKRCNINGIDFPEDLTIIVDVLSIHYNKDLWGPVDPHVFHPMRFATKRNALAYMAFGAGPRNCIGMKFALMELKMCLIKIFSQFEVKKTENTNEKLDFIEGVIGILTHEVNLMFQKRKI